MYRRLNVFELFQLYVGTEKQEYIIKCTQFLASFIHKYALINKYFIYYIYTYVYTCTEILK